MTQRVTIGLANESFRVPVYDFVVVVAILLLLRTPIFSVGKTLTTTRYEIFQNTKKRLLAQGKRCETPTGGCRYLNRGRGGVLTKCAVGWNIPEVHYNPAMEGGAVSELSIAAGPVWVYAGEGWLTKASQLKALATALNDSGIPATAQMQNLLGDLQDLHDCTNPIDWESEFQIVAEKNGLC